MNDPEDEAHIVPGGEKPKSAPAHRDEEEDEDENLPDWKTFNSLVSKNAIAVPSSIAPAADIIPKRGDKDFEPDGTHVQTSILAESRNEMYNALSGLRGHHLKSNVVAVWMPQHNHAVVFQPRGNFFKDCGRAFALPHRKNLQAISLNAIESVYLVERGSIVMYLANDAFTRLLYEQDVPLSDFDFAHSLFQLSLSHLYSLALASDPSSVDKYQVYSYLKRLGYIVNDFQLLSPDQTVAYKTSSSLLASKLTQYLHPLIKQFRGFWPFSWLSSIGLTAYSISHHLHYHTKHYFNYTSLFKSLQFIPSYKTYDTLKTPSSLSTPHKVTFNVWKPTQSFSKKNPPQPDFQIVIINTAQYQQFPTLSDFQSLFNQINYTFPQQNDQQTSQSTQPQFKKTSSSQPTKREIRLKRQQERQAKLDPKIQRRNEYLKHRDLHLKSGSQGRSVLLAVVDNGVISFNKVNEADFTLSGASQLDRLNPSRRGMHGTMYLEKL